MGTKLTLRAHFTLYTLAFTGEEGILVGGAEQQGSVAVLYTGVPHL